MAEPVLQPYDEFSMFKENADEFGIPWTGPPTVRRENVTLPDGRHLSALVWGDQPTNLVFLHGGGQNAHTWDTVALALGQPLIAIDLPGHGHSGPGVDGSMNIESNAKDLAYVIEKLAVTPVHLVGMSIGGLTTLTIADAFPDLLRSATLVDVTPGVNAEKSKMIAAFINGPEKFEDFDSLLARTIEYNPTRTESSLRRGILHNAEQRPDGSWVWRYARFRDTERAAGVDFSRLWPVVEQIKVPLFLARGMQSQSVVDDADEAEVRRLNPHARIQHFDNSGHSLQGDEPVALAQAIAEFTATA
ncbi:MAG: putative hydrolase or acyltransferase of alpha/beta superfamily [Acidimicrobiia bacterium]|nr:putative hydrolase or acyltransferase of alpha/beta superfamily [Acidimicrobiia bacterium]